MKKDDTTKAKAVWIRETLARYEAELVRYTFRITRELERAREIVQETFLKLWLAERSEIEGHLAEWLYTVCRNHALDQNRKDRRQVSADPMDARGPVGEAAAAPGAPDELLEQKQEQTVLLGALSGLSEKYQEVLRLKFQADLSYAEISRITGLTVSNIGYIIHMGLKQLRSQVEQSGKRSEESSKSGEANR
jgi:RNA polymerase sigma-70 factor (ECF subfamily)